MKPKPPFRLPEVTLGPMRIHNMAVRLNALDDHHVLCNIVMDVTDVQAYRDTGMELPEQILDTEAVRVSTPAALRAFVRERVRLAVLHEVDEWLEFDGIRVQDPDHVENLNDDVANALATPLELGQRVKWYLESPRPGADHGIIVAIAPQRIEVLADDGTRTWIWPDEAQVLP